MISTFTSTTPSWCLARTLFINVAFPMVFSYARSPSSGISMLADPGEGVAREKPWPILFVWRYDRAEGSRVAADVERGWAGSDVGLGG